MPAPESAETVPAAARVAIRERTEFEETLPFLCSLGVHVLLLTLILPYVKGNAEVEERPESFTVTLGVRVAPMKSLREPASEPLVVESSHLEPEAPKEEAPVPELPVPPSTDPPVARVVPATDAVATEPLLPMPSDPIGLGAGSATVAGASGTGDSPFGSRLGGRPAALDRFGGGGETELAVSEGLAWLARHQDSNGSWDPAGYQRHCREGAPCRGAGFAEFRVGATALALLAFLGAGVDDEREHPYRATVRNGLEFLRRSQEDDGCFGREGKKYMYNHAIATFCMVEAYQFCEDPKYRACAERALRYSAMTQQPGGGWDYTSMQTLRNDLSITGWQVMAMHAAREAGIALPGEMERRTRQYLSEAVLPTGASIYADRGIGAGRQGISIAAVGLLSRLYMGWSPRSSELRRAAERIIQEPPDRERSIAWERYYQSTYYWYYATLALFHMGGERWDAWNTLLRRELIPLQHQEGERRGSWDADPNWLGAEGGRVAATAFNVLTFEVYYRYKPIYQTLGLAPDADPSPARGRP